MDELRLTRVEPVGPSKPAVVAKNQPAGQGFTDVLRQVQNERELKFSRHAKERLEQRGITLAPLELREVRAAVDRAAAKGARDSLVLMGDLALIVNVPNRTVVTATAAPALKDSVFTNIDSAVIVTGRTPSGKPGAAD